MPAPPRSAPDSSASSRSRLTALSQFFLIPLVVVLIGVSVFLLFGLVGREQPSPRRYLEEIRSGSATRRWQAAFEFSRLLRQGDGAAARELVPEILQIYGAAAADDPKIQRYLAQALGFLRDPRAIDLLADSLHDPDAETRIWAAEALGSIGTPAAARSLSTALSDDDPGVRKEAVYSLGRISSADVTGFISPLLQDPVTDVRWNAALALARQEDDAGLKVLLEMIDRDKIHAVPGIRPDQEERAMVAALTALGSLADPDSVPVIRKLSQDDQSLKVRQAALQVLAEIKHRQEATNPNGP
ncbi:MAG: HEAT repeat domain-containing protein [Acidobacteriota bacterium]